MILALVMLLSAAQTPSRAPSLPLVGDLAALGELKPQPGSWAEYRVTRKNDSLRVRISVLSTATPAGTYWLELDTASPGAPPQAVRMLVHGTPVRATDIERMELYMLGQAPIQIPVDQLKESLPDAHAARGPRLVRRGEEYVVVPAGSFKTEALQSGRTRLWRSAQVPLWGLVKAVTPTQTFELLGSGSTGAHSVFPDEAPGHGSDRTK